MLLMILLPVSHVVTSFTVNESASLQLSVSIKEMTQQHGQ